jgi:asparagine synthase (glutamine-hydrolysing)
MLSMKFYVSDIPNEPIREGSNILFGGSNIEPFASRFIRSTASVSPHRTLVMVGELGAFDDAGGTPTWRCPFDELDVEAIEITVSTSRREMSVRRSVRPGTPIYVSYDRECLVVSWRFEEAVANLRNPTPNAEACALYVKHGPTITRDQIIAGVYMLWPGEAVVLAGDRLVFHPIQDDAVVVPAAITNHARVTDALQEIIGDAASAVVTAAQAPLLELSGGLDSTCVALAVRSQRKQFASYGLIHHGAVGVQQRDRRAQIVELLGLDDHEFAPDAPAPIEGLSRAEAHVTPFDDNHRQACATAMDALPFSTDLVLTGIGGDELAMTRTFTRQPWEVPGTSCPSALISVAARADMFMRRGIWVSNPLTAPSVVDFCRALPTVLRDGRMFNMLLLARAGLSDGFLFPRHTEGFGHTMQREAALFDFHGAMSDSIIGDLRLLDYSDLLRSAAQASNGGFSYKLIMELYYLMKLERVLGRYVR